ncbi:hypothetical protein TDMWS_02250 [Thermodesulfomicrobium sp. WS]|nr:hypothetical protein TDMWS_02250 [Thermodesulfomicrobium sp. WS]
MADVLPNDLDLKTLVTHGFYQALEEAITDDNLLSSFNWANSNKELVIKYLSDNPISQNVALAIYRAFNSEHYAWHLAEYLNRFFAQNQNKRAEYRAFIGGDPYIGVPQAINSLANP